MNPNAQRSTFKEWCMATIHALKRMYSTHELHPFARELGAGSWELGAGVHGLKACAVANGDFP